MTLEPWRGRLWLQLRWYVADDAGGMRPTPAGVMVPVERLADLEAAVRRARALAERPSPSGEPVDAPQATQPAPPAGAGWPT